MPTQREIAKEHGMSFESVVRMYARDGHSINDTAGILGRNPGSFRKLCQRQGWVGLFRVGQDSVAARQAFVDKRGRCTPGLEAAMEAARAANPTYHSIEWGGTTDTVAGHCRRLGLSISTVRKRLDRRPGDYAYAFADKKHYVKPETSKHRWRKMDITKRPD